MRTIYLSVIIMLFCFSLALLYSSGYRFIHSRETLSEKKSAAIKILEEIVMDMQSLAEKEADIPNDEPFEKLTRKYSYYDLSLMDCAAGINELFFPDLISDKMEWRFESCAKDFPSDYGWMNADLKNQKGIEVLKENFHKTNENDLFPIINKLPLYNVYSLDTEFLQLLLDAIGINNNELRAKFFYGIDNEEILSAADIIKIFGSKEKATVSALFGTKTTFWKIDFIYDERIEINAIVCAIPEKNNSSKIKEYQIIERRINVL